MQQSRRGRQRFTPPRWLVSVPARTVIGLIVRLRRSLQALLRLARWNDPSLVVVARIAAGTGIGDATNIVLFETYATRETFDSWDMPIHGWHDAPERRQKEPQRGLTATAGRGVEVGETLRGAD
jgi:hypothetical protein